MYSPGGEDDGLYGEHGCEQDEPVSVTSRLSVKQVVTVVQSFGEYKRWLVSEIGFGGMLKLPLIAKIDLKLSLWVMRKVEVLSRMIVIDKDRKLLFTPEDFHKVFGVPCGNRDVRGRDGDISIRSVEFIKDIIGMNRSAAHSLKAAEIFLYRDINESSTKMEKDCFQIAFVIFVLGYVIAPSTKHDYMTIDFWGAVANPELIGQFNWCQYAMDKLMGAVIKLKHDDEERATTINLFGCHFFFQIFLLDNIDLGLFNMKHDVLPRVQCFDAKRLREMIIMAYCPKNGAVSYVPAALRPADDVCYKRVLHVSDAVGGADIDVQKDNPSCSRPVFNIGGVNPPLSAISNRASISKTSVEGSKSAHVVIPDPRSVGPIEFSSHVRQSCQDDPICILYSFSTYFSVQKIFLFVHPFYILFCVQSLRELSLLLNEQNARCRLNALELRNKMQADMFSFADRLVSIVKEHCRCCARRGLKRCITLVEQVRPVKVFARHV